MRTLLLSIVVLLASTFVSAASKTHVVSLGKTTPVKLFFSTSEDRALDITVRGLYVDSRLKEFTTGPQHEVTDREFVIRRAYRINDTLPDETRKVPK